jgi:pyruvate,orthophosphate dikinase
MLSSVGILTSSGGRTSHAALVARQFGKPAVVGATELDIDMKDRVLRVGNVEILEGEWVSIDGTSGEVYAGQVETVPPDLDDEWLSTLLSWADEYRTLGVRANADEAADASKARSYGAEGIGLCRTEHMFFHPERLPIVQTMITAPSASERREAVQALLPFQREDFAGLFDAMDGLPVIIRLLDPPLHEFLPGRDELVRSVADLQIRLGQAGSVDAVDSLVDELTATRSLLRQVSELHESNPMLGLRGVRLGIRIPDLTRMQARAVAEAAIEAIQNGRDPKPEIMVPLVGHASELAAQRQVIEEEIAAVVEETGVEVTIPVGTMIEIPRAALTAGEIVEHAEFLSFGTNDLTQTTLAISRDDAEGSFLLAYLTEGILETNPFATIDKTGVGRLMTIALEDARGTRPDIVSGVCGEHGGDPTSIHLCHAMGISYVSCSPHRVPVARLAAAQAALAHDDT